MAAGSSVKFRSLPARRFISTPRKGTGNLSGAAFLYEEALSLAEASEQWKGHADALRLQLATSQLPHIYDDADHASRCWFHSPKV